MSLNNINLNDELLSELYKGKLIASEGYTMPHTPPAPTQTGTAPSSASASTPPATPTTTAAQTTASIPLTPTAAQSKAEIADPVTVSRSQATLQVPAAPATTPQPTPPATPAQTTASQPQAAPANTGYKFLGNNKRRISIIVNTPGAAFLPDDQLAFLGKMLEACKMNIADVAIVNQATTPVDIAALKRQLNPAFVLLFGTGPVEIKLPMNFPAFRVQTYDECTYLGSPSLAELLQPGDEGKQLKGKLWAGLKTMFNI